MEETAYAMQTVEQEKEALNQNTAELQSLLEVPLKHYYDLDT